MLIPDVSRPVTAPSLSEEPRLVSRRPSGCRPPATGSESGRQPGGRLGNFAEIHGGGETTVRQGNAARHGDPAGVNHVNVDTSVLSMFTLICCQC